MTIRAVIFDFGGVLMKTGDSVGRREWEARLNLRPGDLERVVHGSRSWIEAQLGKMTPEQYWRDVAGFLGISESDLPQLQRDYFRDDALDLDLVGLLTSLRRRGFKLGLLSNDAPTLENKLRSELRIYDLFDAVIISAFIGVMKPDSAAYAAVAHALNVTARHSAFIDDNQANVEGARKFGMEAVHYQAGMDLRNALRPILEIEGEL